MKDLGYTNDRNHIVEMNQEEYGELSKLAEAIEGRLLPDILSRRDYFFEVGFDFSKTFSVIRAFYLTKFFVNQLQEHLDKINHVIEQKES